MPSIYREAIIAVPPEAAWTALRDVGRARALFAPVLADSRLDGDVRTVRFANGMEVRERILDVDEKHRRVAYAALDASGLEYHHASMQIDLAGPGQCAFVWITDFLPASAGAMLTQLIEQGTQALQRTLESAEANVGAGIPAAAKSHARP